MAPPLSAPPDQVRLQHRLFSGFADPLFRRAETDGTPVMVVLLGEREAALPLRALQREFDIADDSEDGRMLALITASLDFIAGLRIGDALPAEVLSGEASWQPSQQHLRLANAKLRLQLASWARSGAVEDRSAMDSQALLAAADAVETEQAVREGFRRVAEASLRYLGVTSGAASAKLQSVTRAGDLADTTLAAMHASERPELLDPAVSNAVTPKDAVKVPDATGMAMRDAIRTISGAGFVPEIEGSGRLVRQAPSAGGSAAKGTSVRLLFEPAS